MCVCEIWFLKSVSWNVDSRFWDNCSNMFQHIHILCKHTCTHHTHKQTLYLYANKYMHTYAHVCTCTHTHKHKHTHTLYLYENITKMSNTCWELSFFSNVLSVIGVKQTWFITFFLGKPWKEKNITCIFILFYLYIYYQ